MKVFLIAALLFSTSSAFAESQEPVNVVSIVRSGNLMPPVSPGSLKTTLKLRVASGGCTSAADFAVNVKTTKTIQSLTIARVNQDVCEAYLPEGAIVEVKVKGLDRKDIKITNPELIIDKTVN